MYKVAGIDVHKRVLVVVVADAAVEELQYECRRFGTTTSELHQLRQWLEERGVAEVVMESTAQYWKPVWMALEPQFRLHLAQAHSNRAPRGRKHDFGDAQRLVRRLLAAELMLSYVPDPEQRAWRTMTRSKVQLVRDRVRLQNQIEALLEETRIKLSSVVSDLLGVSGRRILHGIASGETDPAKLAALGHERLKCTPAQLQDALSGSVQPPHRQLLELFLERLELLDAHIGKINQSIAEGLRAHQEAVLRLAEVPGFGPDSAQQVIAEIGPRVLAFDSSAQLASWVGVCPGRAESAGQNHSARSAKGNPYLRRLLTQAAQAAVHKKGSRLHSLFHRLLPRLGYQKAIWAIAHRLCRLVWKILHDQVRFVESGEIQNPQNQKRRVQKMLQAFKNLGYSVQLTPLPLSGVTS